MATQASIDQVQKIYIAYYGRPADPAGLEAWANALDDAGGDLSAIINAFGTSPEAEARFGGLSSEQTIITLYNQLFDRDPESQEIIDAWVDQLENNPAVTAQTIALDLLNGAQNQDAAVIENKFEVAARFTAALDSEEAIAAYAGQNAVATGVALLESVDASTNAASHDVHTAIKTLLPTSIHTLTQATDTISIDEVLSDPVLVTMWGYNPHAQGLTDVDNLDGDNADTDAFDDEDANVQGNDNNLTNEGPQDGGVPLSELLAYIQSLAGIDFAELGLIDVTEGENSADGEWQNGDVSTSLNGLTITQNDNGTVTIAVEDGEGEVAQAEVEMADYMFDLLSSLILDNEGNSRLYQQEMYVVSQTGGFLNGPVYSTEPQVLTPSGTSAPFNVAGVLTTGENNGFTIEEGLTTDGDDTIVAGRLDLLHGAEIDAGAGNNTLEIDAKGHFAQPLKLVGIQTINIQNLQNVYTGEDDNSDANYPDVIDSGDSIDAGDADSIIDLSRALDLESLTITEGEYEADGAASGDIDASISEGDLIVTGVRGNATLTLEGDFENDVTVNYSQGMGDGVNLVLNLGDTNDATFDILQNAATINIDSIGGGNAIDASFGASSLMNMNISGDARLEIAANLAPQFQANTPAVIDASANTAGVDLSIIEFSDEVHFTGSQGDDHLDVNAVRNVVISSTEGANEFSVVSEEDITITVGDANNQIEAASSGSDTNSLDNEDVVTVTAGNGNNDITVDTDDLYVVTVGDGDNRIELAAAGSSLSDVTEDDWSVITVGDGQNEIDLMSGAVSLTAGEGNNEVQGTAQHLAATLAGGDNTVEVASLFSATVTAGAGDNSITLSATGSGDSESATVSADGGNNTIVLSGFESSTVTTTGGDDSVTILGGNINFGSENNGTPSELAGENGDETLIVIDLGAGENTLTLGTDNANNTSAVTVVEGSSIAGQNITLVIDTAADLSRADSIDGVTSVILNNSETLDSSDDDQAGADFTITAAQFTAMGGAAAYTVAGASFGAKAVVNIVITTDTTFSDLINTAEIPAGLLFNFTVAHGAEFTLSAEELHYFVTPAGIDVSDDNADNQVILTDAGVNFNAFSGTDLTGGNNGSSPVDDSLSGGSLANGVGFDDITIIRSITGFERPEETTYSDTLTITSTNGENNTVAAVNAGAVPVLILNGDEDMTFTGPVTLADNFTIDFSDHTGVVSGLTINNFEDITATTPAAAGQIIGNGAPGTRIDVIMGDNGTAGAVTLGEPGNTNGLTTSGVSTYVVTDIQDDDDAAWIYLCDNSQDIEFIGLQGNEDHTLVLSQIPWGAVRPAILLEGDGGANWYDVFKVTGNPNESNVGTVVAQYFHAGALSTIEINNQGVALGETTSGDPRPIVVDGIVLNNAHAVTINGSDGNIIIETLNELGATTAQLEEVTFTSAFDVTLQDSIDNLTELEMLDASAVDGTFTLEITQANSLNDLSAINATGIDAIVINVDGGDAALTLTMDQLEAIGAANISTDDDTGTSTFNLVGFDDRAVELQLLDVDNIGNVITADVDGTIVVHPDTNFGDADAVVITALTSDTTLQMTAAQYNSYCGETEELEGETTISCDTEGYDATLALVDIAADSVIDLSPVDQDPSGTDGTTGFDDADDDIVDVVITIADVVATEDMEINGGDATLMVEGTVDLTEAGDISAFNAVNIADGATLTLTAAQAFAIGFADVDMDGEADAWSGTGTLNIVDLNAATVVDLDSVAATGITVDTVSIENTDTLEDFSATTTTFGGASIVTPTATTGAPDWGSENTIVTLTIDQFLGTSGTISGDSQINLAGLYNNIDTDGDFTPDSANFDFSGIANAGTISFATDTTANEAGNQHVITLTDTANLGGFEILLGEFDFIRFATEAQAAAEITVVGSASPTGVQWLWTDFTAEVDTAGYDNEITTLFIDEALLVSQPIEEDLWSTLASEITVEKINGETIPELIKLDRTNTFEALTRVPGGVNYDDSDEYSTIADLTINLEGEVSLGTILLGDTLNGNATDAPDLDGVGFLNSVVINSYQDLTNIDGFDPASGNVPGRVIEANYLGDIQLNAGSIDELVDITINTYADADGVLTDLAPADGTPDGTDVANGDFSTTDNGFYDLENVNGVEAERDGLAIETGTITFDSLEDAELGDVTLTLTGDNDITIAGVDITDAEITVATIDMSGVTANADVTIGGIEYSAFDLDGDPLTTPTGTMLDTVYLLDGYSGDDTFGTAGNDLIQVNGGTNDLTQATTTAVEGVYVTGDATITMTAAQIIAIGEENFTTAPGVTVTLNVTGLGAAEIDLNEIADSGFNIGTVSTVEDASTDVHDNTTFGGADQIQILMATSDVSFRLSAEQFEQLATGTIVEVDSDATTDNDASVEIYGLEAIEDAATNDVTIDLSNVATEGANNLQLGDEGVASTILHDLSTGNQDVTFTAATVLNPTAGTNFSVELFDIDDAAAAPGNTPNELAGETVRFSTAIQAEREIIVTNADDDTNTQNSSGSNAGIDATENDEQDTNVIWLFDNITGTSNGTQVDTSEYSKFLGRLWINDVLVTNNNGDVEDIITGSDLNGDALQNDLNLDGAVIIRIVNTSDLDELDPISTAVDRTLEIESYTDISATGLVFDEEDQLVHVRNLDIDLGGAVNVGDIELGNIIAANADDNTDEFGTLTINSLEADAAGHYLLPEGFDIAVNPLPDSPNMVGDIFAGTRDELTDVDVFTGDGTTNGVAIEIQTITFSDDGDTTDTGAATFDATGTSDVTVKGFDTTDPEITTFTSTNSLVGAVLTVTGGSPGMDGGAAAGNTETFNTVTTDATSETYYGYVNTAAEGDPAEYEINTDGTNPYAGVYGEELSFINVSGAGDTALGYVIPDGTNDDRNEDGDTEDAGDEAFTLTVTSTGTTSAIMGAAMVNGTLTAPTLAAESDWVFIGEDASNQLELTISETAVLNDDGNLTFTNTEITIDGAVDFSELNIDLSGGGNSINVPEGAKLTVSVEQLAQADMVDITGSGTICVVGDASGLAPETTLDTTHLRAVNIDLSQLIVDSDDDGDTDTDDALAVDLSIPVNAIDDDSNAVGFNVIGSNASDTVTGTTAADSLSMGLGDDVLNHNGVGASTGNNSDVTAGTDTVNFVRTGDTFTVATGATANVNVNDFLTGEFVATDETVNNGTANLVGDDNDADGELLIDMTLATGSNGFSITGDSADNVASTLIGSAQADVINAGDLDQDSTTDVDTLTGNGGADVFAFDVNMGNTTQFTQSVIQSAVDVEGIDVTAPATGAGNFTVNYTVNGAAYSVIVALAGTETAAQVATAIAQELQTNGLFVGSAVVDGTDDSLVVVTAESGDDLEITGSVAGGTGVTIDINANAADLDGRDVGQTIRLSATGDPTNGDNYAAIADLNGYVTDETGTHTAGAAEDADDVLAGIAGTYSADSGDISVADVVLTDGYIDFEQTDAGADDGGFELSVDTTAAFGGSGASSNGGLDYTLMDIVTDFETSVDKIHFPTADGGELAAGSGSNYDEVNATQADFAAALADAQTQFTNNAGTLQYYMTSATDLDGAGAGTDGAGILFFDANLDGTIDGGILLTGVTQDTFAAFDIQGA